MELQLGQAASEFTLFNTEKNKISLVDYKGKNVLILFFPLAFTGVCTTEQCSMRDNLAQYNNANAEVLAISVDSIFTLDKFKKENNFNFELLSDFNKEVSKQYNTLYDTFVFDMHGVSKRSAFVVDKNGVLQYSEILDNAGEIPNFDAIQKCLENLK